MLELLLFVVWFFIGMNLGDEGKLYNVRENYIQLEMPVMSNFPVC